MTNPIIIFGSSRSRGNTWDAIQMVLKNRDMSIDAPIIDLNDLNISGFDYKQKNKGDDFNLLTEKMLAHDPIIFATPVYWYAMSSIMKIFIDRWSDFLTSNKEAGRKLRGKTVYIITSYYTYPEGKDGFDDVFKKICKYMGMNYGGCFFHYSGEDKKLSEQNVELAQILADKIFHVNK
jgi:multimeric flavodoxin WrbA